ncbi:MAG TPA: DUF2723 domain-containing protein [bacterium]|nr:DUF2723 domain-containing protein [bacterium]
MKSTGSKAVPKSPGPPFKTAWFLGAGLFLLNLFLVSPFIGWYDSGELLAATQALGISHPSGQALYHLLGKCFLALPALSPAFRLGLLSVTASALASGLFFLLAARLAESLGPLSPRLTRWLALLTLAWSLSLPWWTYSLTVLVYSLHAALILGAIWVASGKSGRRWWGVALLLGAAVVFRPTQYFGLAALGGLYLWESRGRRRGPEFPIILSLFLVGFSTALYFPLRSALHPAIAFADIGGPGGLLRQILALKFSKSLGTGSFSHAGLILGQLLQRLWDDLTPFGLALLGWGLALVGKERGRWPLFFWAALVWALLEGLLVLSVPYPAFESHQFLYPWIFLGWVAALLLAGWNREAAARKTGSFDWRKAVTPILVLWVLAQVSRIGELLDRRQERGAQDFARDVLKVLGPRALYVPSEENQYFPVVGYQLAEGIRPDLEILEPGREGHDAVGQKLRDALLAGRPVYVNRPLEGLPGNWYFKSVGPLLEITDAPPATQRPLSPGEKPLAAWGGVRLLSLGLSAAQVPAGGLLTLRYEWSRSSPGPADFSQWAAVYFVDDGGLYPMRGGNLWLHDIHPPFGGRLPFGRLAPGTAYGEQRVLFIPSDFPPGRYHLMVALQKSGGKPRAGQESFTGDFYDRAGEEDLEKFTGRPGEGFFTQFAPETGEKSSAFVPLTYRAAPGPSPYFAKAGDLQITAPEP